MQRPKRILLVAPRYFKYDSVIKGYLEAKGFGVDLINDRPYDSNIFKAIIRVNRSIINQFLYAFYKREVLKKSAQAYALIFVIQGEGLVPKFLQWLRAKYNATPMVYYLWDSIKNKPKLQENFIYFDRVITFDYKDAKELYLDFVPLFFTPDFKNTKHTKLTYDLSFIGTLHGDRGLLIQSIKKQKDYLKIFIYLYTPSRWIFFIRRFFDKHFFNIDLNDLHFKQLPYDEVQNIRRQSKVILDIHNKNQSGLTIRTIETLALQKKIATTNIDVKYYDFYHPQNIYILNRRHLDIPVSFLKSPFKPLSPKIINRYSLEGFYRATIEPYLNKDDKLNQKEPFVAILMTTFNGEKFLAEQLNSIESQLHRYWKLIVSDDGSSDKTLSILKSYQKRWGKSKLIIRRDSQKTFSHNFLSLATDKKIKADFYAYCDQDDIWLPNKLSVAIKVLQKESLKKPLLYCGRTLYVDEYLKVQGLSPLYNKPPIFQNALVQNIAEGNTMVFNNHSKKILESMGIKEIISYDWWTYLLVTAVGGKVIYDETSHILYRQHKARLIGADVSISENLSRLLGFFKGRFRDWNTLHIDALTSSNLKITSHNQLILARFLFYRMGHVFERLKMVKANGLYSQSWQGNFTLYLAALLKRI